MLPDPVVVSRFCATGVVLYYHGVQDVKTGGAHGRPQRLGTSVDSPDLTPVMGQNSVRHLDYAKREATTVRHYDMPAEAVEWAAHDQYYDLYARKSTGL